PLAVAAVEPPGRKRSAIMALSGVGMVIAIAYYSPVLFEDGLKPAVVGLSIRYDVSSEAVAGLTWWWVWPILYLTAVSVPLLVSRVQPLRPLGASVALSATAVYLLHEQAFASVWCFFAALLSLHLAYVLFQLPDPSRLIV